MRGFSLLSYKLLNEIALEYFLVRMGDNLAKFWDSKDALFRSYEDFKTPRSENTQSCPSETLVRGLLHDRNAQKVIE